MSTAWFGLPPAVQVLCLVLVGFAVGVVLYAFIAWCMGEDIEIHPRDWDDWRSYHKDYYDKGHQDD